MQAATLPLLAGWQWIHDGWKLFLRQPMAMLFWSLVTGTLINLSYFLPIIGQVLLIGATPALAFLILSACRRIANGQRVGWGMWLQPLRTDPARRQRLIRLGVLYLAFCLAGGLLATLPFLNQITAAIGPEGHLDEAALLAAMRGPLITFGLLYIAISALFWHAPALTGWHGIKIVQAMFYSMVACWRNKWPFLAYGASWAAIFMALNLVASALVGMGMAPASAQTLLMPVNIVLAAVLYCSFYPAYVSVFGANYPLDHRDDTGSLDRT